MRRLGAMESDSSSTGIRREVTSILSVLASMVAPLAWMQAVVRLGPSRTTQFFNLLPLITALIAAVVLHEQLALYHLVGGALTLGGVIVCERWTRVLGRR